MTKAYRRGAVGALMDEYERAAGELARILEGISDDEYEIIRDADTEDEDCRSIQTIVVHVVGSGYGYAGLLRDAWKIERIGRWRKPVARSDARAELQAMLDYTCATLDGRWDLPEGEATSLQIRARWGPEYNFEQLFEHAIVHVLRHRRQIERFLSR